MTVPGNRPVGGMWRRVPCRLARLPWPGPEPEATALRRLPSRPSESVRLPAGSTRPARRVDPGSIVPAHWERSAAKPARPWRAAASQAKPSAGYPPLMAQRAPCHPRGAGAALRYPGVEPRRQARGERNRTVPQTRTAKRRRRPSASKAALGSMERKPETMPWPLRRGAVEPALVGKAALLPDRDRRPAFQRPPAGQ